jgi:hypothetical protein
MSTWNSVTSSMTTDVISSFAFMSFFLKPFRTHAEPYYPLGAEQQAHIILSACLPMSTSMFIWGRSGVPMRVHYCSLR